jgi:very-short-patch-repair endonuclease
MKKAKLITNFRELPYNPELKNRAREMRNQSSKGEIKFWCELLRNRKSGYQFYRQKPIDHYIVDFYCPKLKLVIEIDGTSHIDKIEYDKNRDEVLKSYGLFTAGFNDLNVLCNFHLIEKDFNELIKQREILLGIDKSPFSKGSTRFIGGGI